MTIGPSGRPEKHLEYALCQTIPECGVVTRQGRPWGNGSQRDGATARRRPRNPGCYGAQAGTLIHAGVLFRRSIPMRYGRRTPPRLPVLASEGVTDDAM